MASCPPHIFRDILQSNRAALRGDMERLMTRMQSYLDVLDEEGGQAIQERFRKAQQFRRRLPGLLFLAGG